MNASSPPRTLTWLTLVAALSSALLLADADAGLPDLKNLGSAAAAWMTGSPAPTRHSLPALPYRSRDVDPRRREH